MEKTDFNVVIVGGSVAGLALAHCLEVLGVSYTILERGDKIAPNLGASIGILPNGGRILDQLGIFGHVESEVEPLEVARICYSDGFWFKSRYPKVLQSNYCYPISFLERQKFIQILHDTLKGKDRVFTGKKVVCVEDGKSKALVKTADGTEYMADLVVGADGVHSIVRSEIFRQLQAASLIPRGEAENTGIKYEFSCIYGTSVNVPHIELGVQLSSLDNDVSIHAFTGKKSKLFWFVIVRSGPEQYQEASKYSEEAATLICERLRHQKLNDSLAFGDIWSRRTIFKMTPLEEGVFKRWNYGRLVCTGDAVRKMAPNIGQGANLALEDAARLTSLLAQKMQVGDLSHRTISAMLQEFAEAQRGRTVEMCSSAEFLVRMHACQGWGRWLMGRCIIPLLRDAPAGLSGMSINGAARIEYLSLPARSLEGAWDPSFSSVLSSMSYLTPKPSLPLLALLLFIAAAVYLIRQ